MKAEKKIQAEIIKHLEKKNFTVFKAVVMSKRGFPDLIAIRNPEVFFFEVKIFYGLMFLP